MSQPLVSIVIAAYKSNPEYLHAAIASAVGQTWKNIEVMISDDSPDETIKPIVDKFQDARLSYIHNSPSLGVAKNHWSCFRKAKGEYIAVLNHDDLLAPNFLEVLIPPLIADPENSLSFCDHWIIDSHGQQQTEQSYTNSNIWGRDRLQTGAIRPFYHLFAAQSIPMVMGAAFRKSCLPADLPDNAGPAYDLWLAFLLCRHGHGAYYHPERLTSWRAHAENITTQGAISWSIGTAKCWTEAYSDPHLMTIHPIARRKAAIAWSNCAMAAWRSRQRIPTWRYAWKSIIARPTVKGLVACILPFVPRLGTKFSLTR